MPKNWHFSKGVNQWFWSKNGHFSNFFLGNIGEENVFYDILIGKTPFKAIKTRSSKSRKIAIFPTFFSGNIGQENIFCYILERKNAFPGYKNKMFKKSKNWPFSKVVNPWFWSQNGHFSNFFLGNIC